MELNMDLILHGPDKKALETVQRLDEICVKCGQRKLSTKPLTFRDACADVLGAMTEKDRQLTGAEKIKRGCLAHKLYDGDTIDLSIDELALLKARTGEVSSTYVAYAINQILEGTTKEKLDGQQPDKNPD